MNKSSCLIFESNRQEPFRIIFRVQDSDGRGPYRIEHLRNRFTENPTYCWTNRRHSTLSGHPNPDEDQGFDDLARDAMNNLEFPIPKFGFESKHQLSQWFNEEELNALEKLGFEIVQEKAKIIWSSGVQLFYHPY